MKNSCHRSEKKNPFGRAVRTQRDAPYMMPAQASGTISEDPGKMPASEPDSPITINVNSMMIEPITSTASSQ